MASGTRLVLPVQLQLRTHRLRDFRVLIAFVQRGDVRRRRRRGRVQEGAEHILAAVNRRGSGGDGSHCEDASLPQQPAAIGIGELHAAELRAVNALDAVMPGEPLVDEGVVRVQELKSAAVFAQNVAEEHLGLGAESLADVVVEIGEHQQIRNDLRLQVAELQPLPGEIVYQGVRAVIREHAVHLSGEHFGFPKPPRCGRIEQLFIGDAAPQEERQTRGKLEVADRMRDSGAGAGWIALDSI